MNRDDITKMAKNTALKPLLINTDGSKCEVYLGEDRVPIQTALEHFAELVAAAERKFWMEQIEVECNEAVLAEREACAKVADDWPDYDVQGLAEAIRARGSK